METIVKKITYALFKKVHDKDLGGLTSDYFYIRSTTDGIFGYQWFMGYKNIEGLVSSVGGNLTDAKVRELEQEYQKYCNNSIEISYKDI